MAGISTDEFFKSKRDTSEIKSEILVKYFKFWCGVLLFAQKFRIIDKLLYIDLFSGPGRYQNGEPSTPVKILESIIASNGRPIDLNKAVKTFFNDEKKNLIKTLDKNILELPYYNDLLNKPVILNKSVNKDLLSELLEAKTPSLTFIDPFGYSYSMEMLLNSVKEWGSDLFMLFNINRIRAAINNPTVEDLMNEIFQDQLSTIRKFYKNEPNPRKREVFIIDKFEGLFKSKGYFVFKFRINFPDRNQTSHYLYLVTKVKLAYFKIKDIMKNYSDLQSDEVPLFSANSRQDPIFFPEIEIYSVKKLSEYLLKKRNMVNNKSITSIYEEHSIGTNYVQENYKQAITNLWNQGAIDLIDPKGKVAKKVTYTSTIRFK